MKQNLKWWTKYKERKNVKEVLNGKEKKKRRDIGEEEKIKNKIRDNEKKGLWKKLEIDKIKLKAHRILKWWELH